MAIWDEIGRELRHLFEILTTGEASPDDDTREETEEEYTEPGGFFGGDEPPEEPPGRGLFGSDFPDEEPPTSYDDADGGYFTYHAGDGPYKDEWGDAEIRFWDRQFGEHMFDNPSHYDGTLDRFEQAFMNQDLSLEERREARNEFKEWTYIVDIDWDAFSEYYDSI